MRLSFCLKSYFGELLCAGVIFINSFDKGFVDIAAASSHYALIARLACSPSLRFYGYVLLISQKSLIFGKKEEQGSGRMFFLSKKNVA